MEMNRTRYPIGIQNFENLRSGGWAYVDKTALVYDLVMNGQYYFLSRPRRFGKSLLVSTIEAYFQGKRELFRGLAIDSLTEEWDPHPVFHIDLNAKNYENPDSLKNTIKVYLDEWEQAYGLDNGRLDIEDRFRILIHEASVQTGRRAVVLIDEYDKPLLSTVHDRELQETYRAILKGFYGVLKSCGADLRFALLTGVTKFSKVSVFSDLNNLEDITLDDRYATICGITPDELADNFREGIGRMARNLGISDGDTLALLKENYDGYHFSSSLTDVYNPFSLLNSLKKGVIGSFWFETGTPTFLAKMIQREEMDLSDLENEEVDSTRMMTVDLISDDVIPVLFQSGYLTIQNYNPLFRIYSLGYPNREVKEGFLNFLLPYYTPRPVKRSAFDIRAFVLDAEQGRAEAFMKRLTALFSDFPYDQVADCERHYHNVVYLVLTLLGFYVRTEYRTSEGRCDAVMKTDRYIYIFEFKYARSAKEAMRQIQERHYAAPFEADGRQIIRIGVNFSPDTRTISEYIIE